MQLTLKQMRMVKGYTQRDVADHIGVSRDTYLRMENDPDRRINISQAVSIAELFGVSATSLFFPEVATDRCDK